MSLHHNQLRHALSVIDQYRGENPFPFFLKQFFSANKQFGSRDRKLLASLCYTYFRAGKCFPLDKPLQLILSAWLCTEQASPFLEFHLRETGYGDLSGKEGLPPAEKIRLLEQMIAGVDFGKLFPFSSPLSPGIDPVAFRLSHLRQPLLWIRVKSSFYAKVKGLLQEQGITGVTRDDSPGALGLAPGVNLETQLGKFTQVIEVQDLSSQQCGRLYSYSSGSRWWDCCAASGGKSLLLLQQKPGIDLYASDIRPQILQNLKKRFSNNRINEYHLAITNLEEDIKQVLFRDQEGQQVLAGPGFFDAVIADVPCSGSGTWTRNPDMLNNFSEASLVEYSRRQYLIASHVLPFLKPGGMLFYSTCSVFACENGEVTQKLALQHKLDIIEEKIIKGYEQGSDCMYACVLRKS